MHASARRVLRWLLLGVVVLLLLAAVAATWLVTTQSGLARAVAAAESFDRFKIRIDGATGRLIGPLRIGAIEIDHPRAHVRISGLEADYEPLELLGGRISAEGVRIAEASIALRAAPPSDAPPGFMPAWLRVALDDARVEALRIATTGGAVLEFVDVRGDARITRSEIQFRAARATAPAWSVADASGALRAGRPLALTARADWTLGADKQVAGIARASGDLDRLGAEARVTKPAAAQVAGELLDLDGALRWTAKADVASLDLSQWIDDPPFGPLAGAFTLSGDREDYAATGTVVGAGLPAAGVALDGRAHYSDGTLSVPRLELVADDASATLDGSLVTGDDLRFDLQADWSGLRWPLTGDAVLRSARGTLAASGARDFTYRLDGRFQPATGPSVSGSARGQVTEQALIVEDSSWETLGGRVSAAGRLARGESRRWSASGSASGIDPAAIRPAFPGRLSFGFSGSGTGFDSAASFDARISDLNGTLRGQPVRGGGRVLRSGSRIEFDDVSLILGASRLMLDGTWGAGGNLDARAVSDDLSTVAPAISGSVDATLALRDRNVALAFRGRDLAWDGVHAVVLSADGNFDLDGNRHSWLRLRSNGLTVAGFLLTDMRVSLDGLAAEHALSLRLGYGPDAVAIEGQGGWRDERYQLRLDSLRASGPNLDPWRLESPGRIVASGESADVDPVCLVYQARRVCMEGHWESDGGWLARLRTDAFPLDLVDEDAPERTRFRGQLFVEAAVSAEAGQPWMADAAIELRDGTLQYRSASGADRTVELGDTRATLVSDSARHRLSLRTRDAADLELEAAVDAARVEGLPLGELPLTGFVKGSSRQLRLLPLFVDAVDDAGGDVDLDFTVDGKLAAPRFEGEARIANGRLDFYQANLRLRELGGRLRLAGNSLSIEASGKAGEGTMELDGNLAWRDRQPAGTLTLRGENLLLADVPEARVYASPDLKFSIRDGLAEVTGSVVVPRARIAPADTAGAVLPSADEEIVTAGEEAVEPGMQVRSDIRVTLQDKVAVRAYGLRGNVTGSVRLQSEPDEGTVASGELEVVDGVYRAYGRELEVERGRLLFTGGPVTDPGVDLRAGRELPGYEVGVIARGPLRRPQLTLFSDPSLPQYQIASMLIVGRTSIQGEDDGEFGSSDVTEGGTAFLAGQLGKYVGLDEVGVTQDADTGTEVVIGKYITPRLFVSYGVSLVEEINTLKLRYTIDDRWTVSAESGLESAADIEYRIED